MKEITLKQHMSRIARERQKKLREKLGEEGYRARMKEISKARTKKTKKKYPSDATYSKRYPGNDAPLYPRS